MRQVALGLLAMLAAVIVGCVDAEPDRTTVVVDEGGTPAPNTTVIETDPAPAPETNVDVDIKAEDKEPDVVVDP